MRESKTTRGRIAQNNKAQPKAALKEERSSSVIKGKQRKPGSGNRENLIPLNQRPVEEAREIQRKGGICSGMSRRRKASMKECMELLLEQSALTQEQEAALAALGIPVDMFTKRVLVANALVERAIRGNIGAAHEIRDILGELESDGLQNNDSIVVSVVRANKAALQVTNLPDEEE